LLWLVSGFLTVSGVSGQSAAKPVEDESSIQRSDPPYFGFYAKAIDCDGVFIRGSAAVRDSTLHATCARVTAMLAQMDVARKNLRQRGVEIHIFGREQSLADLPESRRATAASGAALKDARRGAVGIYSACGEEDPAATPPELCIREFAIAVMNFGFDDEIRRAIETRYQASLAAGRWIGTPAAASPQSYWADLSMLYFASQPGFTAAAQSSSSEPADLRRYDGDGFALLDLLYSGRRRPVAVEAIRAREVSKLALSKVSKRESELQLVNNSGRKLKVFWIDTEGVPLALGELGPYSRVIERTFFQHVWMIEDERGIELERFVVEDYLSEVIVAD
jgi:VHL beta domain